MAADQAYDQRHAVAERQRGLIPHLRKLVPFAARAVRTDVKNQNKSHPMGKIRLAAGFGAAAVAVTLFAGVADAATGNAPLPRGDAGSPVRCVACREREQVPLGDVGGDVGIGGIGGGAQQGGHFRRGSAEGTSIEAVRPRRQPQGVA